MLIPFSSSTYGYEMTPLRQRKPRVVAFALAILLVIALALPLPYVIFRPGTPVNVVGKMITVPASYAAEDLASRDREGRLFLTTVFVTTPRSKVFGAEILRAWIRGDEAVYPRDAIYPEDQDAGEIRSQELFEMTSSQQYAIYNALTYLGFDVITRPKVVQIAEESAAKGVLKAGDLILTVDGTSVGSSREIVDLVRQKSPGETVSIEVLRGGSVENFRQIELIENEAGTAIGIFLTIDFDAPVDVSIDIKNTGGPSAGMIFTLGIIEKMSGEDLLRGRRVAGSGTIDLAGRIGGIGGIENKLIGARRSGATLFLASVENCDEIAHIPDGLQVVPVATLKEAVEALRARDSKDLPSCQSPR